MTNPANCKIDRAAPPCHIILLQQIERAMPSLMTPKSLNLRMCWCFQLYCRHSHIYIYTNTLPLLSTIVRLIGLIFGQFLGVLRYLVQSVHVSNGPKHIAVPALVQEQTGVAQ